ncbi:Xaa-Pro aminopeptidase/Xaa-Pro dipeptidase [Abditibacterium utsteinense]|uniref:Xaa-Pro aminopeptidase/Xaa-Pro dipeptidase n=1 Tax=Abditibacterium utsteinense TaxID=1960156 RepID=A0A2S8SVW7_9BACT|nr:aminopeptidase P family protein [Abditibacterium utsteinense]PQV64939.1 Xaa-Pro aminopeptidase/Xaa-Pro dipeptidase [Abditibacterium utsteinense]
MNYSFRLQNLRVQLSKLKCDALAVTHLTNVRYLCGFSGSSAMILITPDAAHFITDFRYRSQAQAQVGAYLKVHIAERGLWQEAAKILKKNGAARVGFEAQHTSVAAWQEIQKLLGQSMETSATSMAVENLRLIKDEDEVKVIRDAVRIADETLAEVLELLRPGLSEREVALAIEQGVRARGASGLSFDTIVASGARGALPHGVASDKLLKNGDMITIDMGAKFNDYCSDMTRTVCLGKANARQKEIYEITYRAQVAACKAITAGFGCKAADAVARKIISDAGYGKDFGHGLGHGVGIDIHEAPRLAKTGKGNLETGMIVTSEPGIYLAEFGGVRIEDMLLVTPDGAEILTQTPKPATLLEL